jgi:hypothetical protein
MSDNKFRKVEQTYDFKLLSGVMIGAGNAANTAVPITQALPVQLNPVPNSVNRLLGLNFKLSSQLGDQIANVYSS